MICKLPRSCKSPCRWPGGKTRATKTLFNYLPHAAITEYREPFLGGGSMAIEFTRRFPTIPVTVSDYDYNVYCFWKTLQESPSSLVSTLLEHKAQAGDTLGHRKLFLEAREFILRADSCTDPFAVAVRFFIVNKCGFSGLMQTGFSEQASQSNFSEKNIRNLLHYGEHISDWTILHADANDMLSNDPSTLVYLDPPYAKVGKDGNSFIYGKDGDMHKSFDHDRFCESVHAHTGPMLISYDNNSLIKSMYADFSQAVFDLTYTLHSGKSYRDAEKERKELVLWNYETDAGILPT